MKRITITNAYTWYNKGDAGILLGTVNALKKTYGENNIEINILSFTPEEDKKRYCKDKTIKNVYSNVLNPHPYKHTKTGKIIAIIKLIIRFLYLLIIMKFNFKTLIKKEKEFELLSSSDIIIVCGGGFLGGKKIDSFMHLFQMYVNTKFQKPVYVLGTSIEPMTNKIVKKATDSILKKMDHIFAREKITYEYLKSVVPCKKITLIPDMAFMLEDKNKNFSIIDELKKKSSQIYGLTVRQWNFPNSKQPEKLMKKYIHALKKCIETEIESNNSSFVFIPQVIVNYASDETVALQLKDALDKKYKDRFIIINDDLSPVEIKALISKCDYFIGTRMHSNIFATSVGIPTIAIAYEKKTNGIMHTVGLDEYVIEMDKITSELLKEKIELQRKNEKQIRENLKIKIDEIRKEIQNKLEKILVSVVK